MQLEQAQLFQISPQERTLLKSLRENLPQGCLLEESIRDGVFQARIYSPDSIHDIDVFYDDGGLVMGIGEWTHNHPETLDELRDMIKRVVSEKIVVWKVTCPNGHMYSGHYDIDDWEANPDMVDEPDSNLESGDRIERATFNTSIEDRVVA